MDSLLANYASSDEEQEEEQQQQQQQYHTASPANSSQPSSSPSKVSPLFDSLSRPKSSSLFSSLPQPKQSNLPIDEDDKQPHPSSKTASVSKSSIFSSLPQLGQPQFSDVPIGLDDEQEEDLKPSSRPKSSSIFLSLPQPKSQNPQQTTSTPPSMGSIPKKVIQFKPPIKPRLTKPNNFDEDDDDEDDEEKERKKRRLAETLAQNSSVKSFLSSIPAPRMSATLGILPSSGSGRRSIIDTEAPTSNSAGSGAHNELGTGQNVVNYAYQESSDNQNAVNYAHNEIAVDQSAAYDGSYGSGIDQYWANSANYGDYGNCDQTVGVSGGASSYGSYENYGSYMSYDNQYGHNWGDGSGATTVPQAVGVVESAVKVLGKRGKNEIPTKIVEVKQDELMKNRPREDQVKLTGIAFGPSYKPVSTQGKPTKLHKRKHQIGSLFYDMKQKEMELAERRAKGFLTKAETQAKYGW